MNTLSEILQLRKLAYKNANLFCYIKLCNRSTTKSFFNYLHFIYNY